MKKVIPEKTNLEEEGDLWVCPECDCVVGRSFDYILNKCPRCGVEIDSKAWEET